MAKREDEVFEEELERVLRRATKLRAAIAGTADISYVRVRACKVAAHSRGAYTRTVITPRDGK